MAKFLGVDTGGTFTDFILFDEDSKSVRIHKVLSTPQSPERAILQGIADLGVELNGLTIVHGSTVATNAVLEGKGARTAYITNAGLADVLSIGRQAREQLYNLTPVKIPPLIERELCVEVNSRLSAQGEHLQQLTELDLTSLRQQLEKLAPEAVAINLLFSFIDNSEELKIEKIIPEKLFISRSSDVLPEYKEYERGMTTALNAKVGPLMQGYLHRLEKNLAGCSLTIMQSSAGATSAQQAGKYPVNLLLSGPAGGLKGAQYMAAASGVHRLLSFDMGGTSTDVSLIDKEIGFTSGAKIGGYPVAIPMVDMHTIGAGGGSIAQLDAGGLLLVGPESAGASPGPACYGKGGSQPTVTDANVVLGRLQPQFLLAGNMPLDIDAANMAVKTIAEPLGISVEQAACGIIDVVNDHMVRALRVMSVERGEDPKEFTLVSFGGAGGLHVCALAEELEMKKALVPLNAGVLSALGMLAADASRERSRTINIKLNDCDVEYIKQQFAELVDQAKQELSQSTRIEVMLSVDLRYQGQSHALNLSWTDFKGQKNDLVNRLERAFHKKHEDSYGHQLDIDIELVNVRVRVIGHRQSLALPAWQPSEELIEQYTDMPGVDQAVLVINRGGLKVGQVLSGPAVITELSATTFLANGWRASVDVTGNLLLST